MTPLAVAEIDPKRRRAAAAEWPGIEVYPSLKEMLKSSRVGLVVVITPHNTHARLALEALRAGRHVVVVKPMAVTTAECDRMIAAARRKRRLVTTYHNRHWDGCILRAAREIRAGAIGGVVRVEARWGRRGRPESSWRSSRSISGGTLYDWGVHLVEYALQIIDDEIVEVSGFERSGYWKTRWGADANEDEASAVVRFANGVPLTLRVTNLDANPKPGWVEVTGTEGSYVFDAREWTLFQRKGDDVRVRRGKNPPHEQKRFYKNVANHLVRGTKLVITPEWARRPIHVLDLAVRSAKAGRALKAKYG